MTVRPCADGTGGRDGDRRAAWSPPLSDPAAGRDGAAADTTAAMAPVAAGRAVAHGRPPSRLLASSSLVVGLLTARPDGACPYASSRAESARDPLWHTPDRAGRAGVRWGSTRARPMPDGDVEFEGLARYAYEIGHLKQSKRTGWWLAGIGDPESVAEHSFRTALLGYVLALMEGADPAKTAALCLFHDTAETRLGDIPSVGNRYLTQASPVAVVAEQTAGLPAPVVDSIAGLTEEYEAQASQEARVARDADKLECLLQAREYEAQGYRDAASWIAPSAASIRTASGRRLAEACQTVRPKQWWKRFVESYIQAAPRPEGDAEDGSTAAAQ